MRFFFFFGRCRCSNVVRVGLFGWLVSVWAACLLAGWLAGCAKRAGVRSCLPMDGMYHGRETRHIRIYNENIRVRTHSKLFEISTYSKSDFEEFSIYS